MYYISNVAVVTMDDGAKRKLLVPLKVLGCYNVPGLPTSRLLSCKKIKPFICLSLYSYPLKKTNQKKKPKNYPN